MRHFSSAQIDGSGSRPIGTPTQRPALFSIGPKTDVLVLILAATLPLFLFTIGMGVTSYRDNFQSMQEELAHIAEVVLVAMDKELSFGLRVADTLTRSSADNFDNIPAFDADARGLTATQSQITMVSLSDLESAEFLSH